MAKEEIKVMDTPELHENFILLHAFEHPGIPLKKWVENDETYTGNYHTDIGVLMPLVEKITTLGYDYSYYNGRACITNNELFKVKEAYIPADGKMLPATYNVVVFFLKNYYKP